MVRTGLDALLAKPTGTQRAGIACNQATIDRNYRHIVDLLFAKGFRVTTLFSPQHGMWGEQQANMIETGHGKDAATGLKVYSLYSDRRIPTQDMLEEVDVVYFDLQDVGSRYYTYASTMLYLLKALAEAGKKLVVLDRPNPIGGILVEGNNLLPHLYSFVGLFPVLNRHGLTMGELALIAAKEHGVANALEIEKLGGWHRERPYRESGLPWILPSPNMPTLQTALVYPGACLLEATNISEGRGTTIPFEVAGAPFIDPYALQRRIQDYGLPGVYFRPVFFQPTFDKFKDQSCGGLHIHVTDENAFRPYLSFICLLRATKELHPREFRWLDPPYEYEYEKLPVDILAGNERVRQFIDGNGDLASFRAWLDVEAQQFEAAREKFLLY